MSSKPKSKPTIHDVVRESGKSLGTISRVINKHPSVTPATRLAVEKAIEKLGYTPNSVAASLRSNVTKVIGLIVADISNPLFAEITKGAEQVLRDAGYSLVMAATGGSESNELAALDLMKKRKVDGLLLSINNEQSDPIITKVAALDIPVCLLDRDLEGHYDAVMTHHNVGIAKAVSCLVDLGHSRIALISADKTILPGRGRLDGYKRALEAQGIEIDDVLIKLGKLDADFGFAQTNELLDLPQRPTAILSGGNQILPGVLRALKFRNVAIPQDISVIACDDTPLAELHVPPVTIVKRNVEEMGRGGAEMLVERIANKRKEDRTRVIRTELVLRGSCGPCKTSLSD